MDYQNSQAPRQTFKGNWQCSECGAEITEMPFMPDGTKPIYCRDCYRSKKSDRPARGGAFGGPRQTFQGHWQCSECGAEITEMPFQPDGTKPIYCRDCYRSKRSRF